VTAAQVAGRLQHLEAQIAAWEQWLIAQQRQQAARILRPEAAEGVAERWARWAVTHWTPGEVPTRPEPPASWWPK
jgi:hypothetical protein